MENLKIIKLHISEQLEIKSINLTVKLIKFEDETGGKEYEEAGDRYDIEFIFKKNSEQKTIKYGWTQITPDENKHFEVFGYTILHIKDSYEPFSREDEKGHWLKFVVFKTQKETKVNFGKLKSFYLKKDYEKCQK